MEGKSGNLIFSIFVLALFLFGTIFVLNNALNHTGKTPEYFVELAGKKIKVSLAVTPAEQMIGLSGHELLAEDSGMFFVFAEPGLHNFWMKDMSFPIDIIWIDENMKIIYIKENAAPEDGLKTFGPDANSKYVLEVVAGFSKKNNLKVGDEVITNFDAVFN